MKHESQQQIAREAWASIIKRQQGVPSRIDFDCIDIILSAIEKAHYDGYTRGYEAHVRAAHASEPNWTEQDVLELYRRSSRNPYGVIADAHNATLHPAHVSEQPPATDDKPRNEHVPELLGPVDFRPPDPERYPGCGEDFRAQPQRSEPQEWTQDWLANVGTADTWMEEICKAHNAALAAESQRREQADKLYHALLVVSELQAKELGQVSEQLLSALEAIDDLLSTSGDPNAVTGEFDTAAGRARRLDLSSLHKHDASTQKTRSVSG